MTNIFLIGYMGSGKTSVGKALRQLTGLPLLDMDEIIEAEQGRSIPSIFEAEGEQGFREIESQLLARLCRETQTQIVSCGGGIIQRPENVALLSSQGGVFFLHGSPELLFSRIKEDSHRPNARADIADQQTRFSHLCSLYDQRLPLYRQAASHIIEISGKTPRQIAGEILDSLYK